jgi:hypothetical protein
MLLELLKEKQQYEWLPYIYWLVNSSQIDEGTFEKLMFKIMMWRNRFGGDVLL